MLWVIAVAGPGLAAKALSVLRADAVVHRYGDAGDYQWPGPPRELDRHAMTVKRESPPIELTGPRSEG
jgi:hypothetical protein